MAQSFMDSRQSVSFQNDFIQTCFPQKFLQSFLRALLQVIAVGSSDLPKAKQCAAHIFVILFFQLRKQLQPDLVPGIDALMIGMILHRTQIVLPAVLFDFFSRDVQYGPDHGESPLLSLICDPRQPVCPRTAQHTKQDGFRLIVRIVSHSDPDMLRKIVRASAMLRRQLFSDLPCFVIKRIIAQLSAGFFTGHMPCSGKFAAVCCDHFAGKPVLPAKFFHIVLVAFRCSRPESVVHMDRMQTNPQRLPQPQQYMKKAH